VGALLLDRSGALHAAVEVHHKVVAASIEATGTMPLVKFLDGDLAPGIGCGAMKDNFSYLSHGT
jgi:hypothetical protein